VRKQLIPGALRNWLDNGILLGAAAVLSLAIFQGGFFSNAAGRYVAFWIMLPAVWLTAISFTPAARETMLAFYDDLGTTPRRVVAGGAIGAAFMLYVGMITSNIPQRETTRQMDPVASVASIR
jgi:hypothetical protein